MSGFGQRGYEHDLYLASIGESPERDPRDDDQDCPDCQGDGYIDIVDDWGGVIGPAPCPSGCHPGAGCGVTAPARPAARAPHGETGSEGASLYPESRCGRCGGENPVWTAPSPLWNQVMRGGDINGMEIYDGIVCPSCFALIASEVGVADGWRLYATEVHVPLQETTPSGRVWNPETWLFDDVACSCKPYEQRWSPDRPERCSACGGLFVPYSRARECFSAEECGGTCRRHRGDEYQELLADFHDQRQRRERAEQALAFYADPENWQYVPTDRGAEVPAFEDRGVRAGMALAAASTHSPERDSVEATENV